MQLHQQGLNSVQISNEMNRLGIKTPRGKGYNNKIIWVTTKKRKLREDRLNDSDIVINSIKPCFLISNRCLIRILILIRINFQINYSNLFRNVLKILV